MNDAATRTPPAFLTPLAGLALLLGLGGPVLMALAGPGYQWGWWDLMTGFRGVIQWGVYAAIAGAVLGLIAALLALRGKARGALAMAIPALIVGSISAASYYYYTGVVLPGRGYPPIHEVTTDFDDPPEFVAVVPLREADGAANPPEYRAVVEGFGRTVQVDDMQRQAFPDIAPLLLERSPKEAFDTALVVSRQMGWDIVDADAEAGRIEATDTTFWFGFKDDVVIRIRPGEDGGSRVDLRSKSRIGFGDIGANGERVRAFLASPLWG